MQIKSRIAATAAVSASVVALTAAPAFAQHVHGNGNVVGVGNVSILNGNTVNAPVNAPVNLCGGAIAILGFASADCQGGAVVNYGYGF